GIGSKLCNNPIHDPIIPVVPTEVSIAVRRLHLENAFTNLQNRNIKCTTAKIIYGNFFVLLLIEAVGQRRCRRFVDNTKHLHAGNSASVLCRFPLWVVKIGWYRDPPLRAL